MNRTNSKAKQKSFEWVCRQKNLKENKVILGLRESEKLIGQLYPVLVDEQGNVLDGQHRLAVNPNWRKQVVKGADSERKKAMVRLHANWHRRRNHPDQVIRELAKVTKWKGSENYAAFLGCSVRTVQRYLPQEYKLRHRVSKRQVSLGESKEMSTYEVKRRKQLMEMELSKSPAYKVVENLKRRKPSVEWNESRLFDFLANRLYNNVTWRTEEPSILLNLPEIKEKCEFYLTALKLMNISQEEILNRLTDYHKKHLETFREHEKRELRKIQYKDKLDELSNTVTKLVLILNNGSKIEFERTQIPKVHSASWYDYDVLKPLLESYVEKLLGFDGCGLPPLKHERVNENGL